MAKSKNESNNKNSGTLLTEKDGTQYFRHGESPYQGIGAFRTGWEAA